MRFSRGGLSLGLGLFGLGLLVGGALVGFAPSARYLYSNVGSDTKRVDRITGRVEYAGDHGWFGIGDRDAEIEAEVRRFPERARSTIEASARGELAGVRVMGRQVTVYPKVGQPYKLYADAMDDPRLTTFLEELNARSVGMVSPERAQALPAGFRP